MRLPFFSRMTLLAIMLALSAVFLMPAGCTVVYDDDDTQAKGKGEGELEIYFVDGKFDPDGYVDKIWEKKVLPYMDKEADDLNAVLKALKADPEKGGDRYGHREKAEGSPWNFIVSGKGKVVEVNTRSRASTLGVDLEPYDGQADVLVQIGPVIKGTGVRDSLDFIAFDDFVNQLEFARLSNAMNKRINDTVLAPLDRENLMDKSIAFTGVFTLNKGIDHILITPTRVEISGGV